MNTAPARPALAIREALRRKDFVAAESLLQQRLSDQPDDGVAWRDLALVLAAGGRPTEAVQAFASCVERGIDKNAVAFNYAAALSDAGENAHAERLLREVLSQRPRQFDLTNLLGVVLKRSGKLDEAIQFFEQARKLDGKSLSPWVNLGNTWLLLGNPRKAQDAFARVVRLAPKDPEHWRLLGVSQQRCGAVVEARRSFERGHTLNPRDTRVAGDLIEILIETGEFDKALALIARTRQLTPNDARFDIAEARVLRRLGRTDEARERLEQILTIHPDDERALFALARFIEKEDRQAANGYFRRALAAKPNSIEIAAALCESLNRSRYGDEAAHIEESYQIAVSIADRCGRHARFEARTLRGVFARCVDFDRIDCAGSLEDLAPTWIAGCFLSAFHLELAQARSAEDRYRLVDWHRDLGDVLQRRIPRRPVAPAIGGRAKMRVGFMSSDLRAHPVTYFALPLLDFYDRDRFEVFCYSFYERQRDDVQAAIEGRVDGFRWWPRRPEAEVAEGIAADDLDILFELGGSTEMNKLEVMAYKPAPIGASWLGYPHSSGLTSIDYILVDPFIKPEDPKLLVEKPFELPETWVALGRLGFVDVPIIGTIPQERKGHITFGTMNNPYKYTPQCVDAWARIMAATPGSRFLFVRPEGGVPAFRRNIEAAFAKRGIEPERIEYTAVRGSHLPHYNDIDIALDTFPHVGGTTTCETLWMGVPVVSLAGPAFFERLSLSNLSNAGLADLCATDIDGYIAKALELAEDRSRRRALRLRLRGQIRNHPLGQPERFSRAFYDAVERVVGQ
ncbi:MAG: tetratricopeptide repeat protein [Rhodospirillales bacterium]|nr:tetratricopeptide repeat protein [Rhodospirillales bacterium]